MFKKQKRIIQEEFWINAERVPLPDGYEFYDKLNAMLDAVGFDEKVHELYSRSHDESVPRSADAEVSTGAAPQ